MNDKEKYPSFVIDVLSSIKDRSTADLCADLLLVDYIKTEIKDQLELSRVQGKGGWWHPAECTPQKLKDLLIEKICKDESLDALVYAAMYHMVLEAKKCREASQNTMGKTVKFKEPDKD